MRWVNRLLLFKVHDMVHNFLNKAFRGARFTVVHVCTKSAYEVHKRSCTRTSSSFSPYYSTREQLARGRFFEGLQNYMQNKNEGNENKIMLGKLNCTMNKIDRDGENKTQTLLIDFIGAVPVMPCLNSPWINGLRIYGEGRIQTPLSSPATIGPLPKIQDRQGLYWFKNC